MSAFTRRTIPRFTVVLAGLGLFAAACGGSSSGHSATAQLAASQPTGVAQVGVDTHSGPMGTYLTDSSGRSLYLFTADKKGRSACNGGCTSVWPPLLGSQAATNGSAKQAMTGAIMRADSNSQITYNGHPLYRYAGDTKAGDTNGEGLNVDGGTWWLVTAAGQAISATAPAPATSSPASTGSTWS